ncbi:MAG: alpha-galactosidase [Odoribacter sp.]|nr:alpha-galactosidase [Odoribacter sp.]
MKYCLFLWLFLLVGMVRVQAAAGDVIRVSTAATDLIFRVGTDGRLYQAYWGERLLNDSDLGCFSGKSAKGWEVYPGSGMEDYFEPALGIAHQDGNMATLLKYVSVEKHEIDANVTETVVALRDEVYPVEVKLHYMAFHRENIIKAWSEIRHREKKPVRMFRFASSMLYLEAPRYFLTEFSSDWAKEVRMSSQELQFGKKILDTKLGSRAAMHVQPFFQLGIGQELSENHGKVLVGTIGWTGNFRFTFEVDNLGNLRVISGINPYASDYELQPGEWFKTPEFIFTLSDEGTGKASRDFHDWARRYQVKDGLGERLTLLNNWENTGFDFNEEKLLALMQEARHLGVDMFLLDDGWFGNKYPRKDDRAGLGDWDATAAKLPRGVGALVKGAEKAGVKFGIWIEPEMVNPKSELFEKHPEWVIHLPNRELYYFRNQLVLDLSNPKVQDFVYGIVDGLMTENPEIAFFKWDCNSPITNIYSPYLKEKQSQLYVDHVRGIYRVLERLKAKYPHLPMMLCSGGGARCDYEALKYFTEFWPSDNTDPLERIFIQWGFSQLFPSQVLCAHVTGWGRQSLKFRVDVAMMCKLGFDIGIAGMSEEEQLFCREAVSHFKRLSPVILQGDFYRLVSPYETNHASVMHVAKDRGKAVVYAYDMHPRFGEKLFPVKLQGLDPQKKYKVEEINLLPGKKSRLRENDAVFSGDYLMKVGLDLLTTAHTSSRIIELTVQ